MIARQTAALFLDAYRELNAKKMFWITLVLGAGYLAWSGTSGAELLSSSVGWVWLPA